MFIQWLLNFLVFLNSLLAHKEFRFVFPLTPLAMYFCAVSTHHILSGHKSGQKYRQVLAISILATQVPLAIYASVLHQRGGLDAVSFIGQILDRSYLPKEGGSKINPSSLRLLSLMPCHSVPSVG